MASAPTIRAVGAIASGTTTIAPGLPSGTTAGDLLLMFLENDGSEAAPTASGWTQLLTKATGADTTDTRLTVLYKTAAGSDATTTNDPGDHIVGRIIGITAGTWAVTDTFNATQTSNEDTADTSGSIPGVTTTLDNCLILAACTNGDDPAANGTANYGSWTNANLSSLTERIDNTRTSGNGGGIGVASGVLATAGATGATTVTLGVASFKAMATIAIAPLHATGSAAITVQKAAVAGTGTHPETGIRHDAFSRMSAEARGPGNPQAHTWTHTPSGTPKGVLVWITLATDVTDADDAVGAVTYGGVAMTQVGRSLLTTGNERGNAYLYELLSGVPTGAQTVSVTVTAFPTSPGGFYPWLMAQCVTMAADAAIVRADSDTINNTALTDPSVTMDAGASVGLSYLGGFSAVGTMASISAASGCTIVGTGYEFVTPNTMFVVRQTTPASGTFAIGYTASADDVAMVAATYTESAAPSATGSITGQPPAVDAAGSLSIPGTGAITGAVTTVAGVGIGGAVGTGAFTLATVAVAGTGSETIEATGSLTLPPATTDGVAAQTITGTGALTARPTSVEGTGVGGAVGTGALAAQPSTVAGIASETLSAAGALSLAPATADGAGTEAITATAAVTIQPAFVDGAGSETLTASGAVSLQVAAIAASGDHSEAVEGATGVGSLTTATLTVDGAGSIALAGDAAVLLPELTVDGAGLLSLAATGAPSAQPAAVDGAGTLTITGTGALTVVAPTMDGTGLVILSGSGAATLQPISAAATGTEAMAGSGAITAAVPTLDGTGLVAITMTGSGATVLAPSRVAGVGDETIPTWSTAAIAGPGSTASIAGPGATATVTGPGTTVTVTTASSATTSPTTTTEATVR